MHLSSRIYTSNSNNCFLDVLVLHIGIVCGTVLTVHKLKDAANKLIQAWPILGGKISKKSIPFSFTCGENFDFRSRSLNQVLGTVIDHHKFDVNVQPALLDSSTNAIDQCFLFDTETFGHSNFAIRVTLLQDATLLNFSMPHSVADAGSLFEVICAFCALLKGDTIRDIQLSPDVRGLQMSTLIKDGVHEQPLDSYASYDDHRRTWMPNIFSALRSCGKTLRTTLLFSLGYSELQERLICIPRQWLDTTRNECMREMNSEETPGSAKLQLSTNDTMVAWLLKLLYGHNPNQKEPIDLISPFNTRSLTKVEESEPRYLHNNFSVLRCHFTATDLKQRSVSWIAGKVRNALLFYKNPLSVQGHWKFLEESVSKFKLPNTTGKSVVITSWAAFDFANLDFSGANPGDDILRPPILFICPKMIPRLPIVSDGLFVSWKDAHESIWIRGWIPTDVIREFNSLGNTD